LTNETHSNLRFQDRNVPRNIDEGLAAFHRSDRIDSRSLLESARDIDERDPPIANWVFAITHRRSDPDDPTSVRKGVAVE